MTCAPPGPRGRIDLFSWLKKEGSPPPVPFDAKFFLECSFTRPVKGEYFSFSRLGLCSKLRPVVFPAEKVVSPPARLMSGGSVVFLSVIFFLLTLSGFFPRVGTLDHIFAVPGFPFSAGPLIELCEGIPPSLVLTFPVALVTAVLPSLRFSAPRTAFYRQEAVPFLFSSPPLSFPFKSPLFPPTLAPYTFFLPVAHDQSFSAQAPVRPPTVRHHVLVCESWALPLRRFRFPRSEPRSRLFSSSF